jgi:hypothetical protein
MDDLGTVPENIPEQYSGPLLLTSIELSTTKHI